MGCSSTVSCCVLSSCARPMQGTVEDAGSVSQGLVLPLFLATLEHVPAPMGLDAALKVYRQIRVALDYMHHKSFAHNDVKVRAGSGARSLPTSTGSPQLCTVPLHYAIIPRHSPSCSHPTSSWTARAMHTWQTLGLPGARACQLRSAHASTCRRTRQESTQQVWGLGLARC